MTLTVIHAPSGGPTPVLGPNPDRVENLACYLARGGYRAELPPEELLARVEAAELRGHGGAGFPTAVKLRAVRDGAGTPVVVANGEEGEPGSVKDRWLLRARPHLVLDGLVQAARITGADRAYVYLSDAAAERSVHEALTERDPGLPVELVRTEPAYVAGEESAVVRRIDGGPALPTAKPPRVFERGVGGAPTLVANVETLARLALLAAAHDATESVLLTLSGGRDAPVLTEQRYGVTLRQLAFLQGTVEPKAVLMGGLFGGLLPSTALELPLDRARLAEAGTGLGCGAIRFLAPGECPVSVATDAVDHLAVESSRQCGVCVSGTRALRDTLVALAEGRCDADGVANLARWAQGLPGRGACGLLDAAARLAGTLLNGFPELVAAHRSEPCPACAATPPDAGRRLRVHVPAPLSAPDRAGDSSRPTQPQPQPHPQPQPAPACVG
ncbi:NADH-ubiquinone oxidoreductase-F iron-sulfur binding region domain-containing protein [Streptacidiphilus anmyonensis]|uniref:NADH-ubiquinone oxidoreductase-F iron-sulfur binding region domain-containing protein n=1 Tax=Streptacidiphilus anmyonensis TaxID=405782 RepID=UPI0006947E69|nr:NADH-ubiquinone oxidoreductase-F iron-sulfur binding region domain-containing protein [Streptacidiphilus anmyonensis]